MGGQGLLLLMELKILMMMTRLQNVTVACYSWPQIFYTRGVLVGMVFFRERFLVALHYSLAMNSETKY